MAKETNPKNTALEADVLKAAGAAGEVDQQAVKDKAAEIVGKALPEGEPVPGKVETMQGQPAPGVQLPGSDLPPVKGTGTPATFGNPAPGAQADPEYLEFLEWKKKQAEGTQEAKPLPKVPDVSLDVRQKAEEAALKAYHDALSSAAATTPHPNPDGEIKNLNANKLHQDRVQMYGEGYVVAKRHGVEQIFTRQTWKLLGGRNNKDGYIEVVATPPEVAALNKPA